MTLRSADKMKIAARLTFWGTFFLCAACGAKQKNVRIVVIDNTNLLKDSTWVTVIINDTLVIQDTFFLPKYSEQFLAHEKKIGQVKSIRFTSGNALYNRDTILAEEISVKEIRITLIGSKIDEKLLKDLQDASNRQMDLFAVKPGVGIFLQ